MADVAVNGDRPWDIHVFHPGFYHRVLAQGTLGLGESYMEGWWSCEAVDELFFRLVKADLKTHVDLNYREKALIFYHRLRNMQAGNLAFKVIKKHYDLQSDIILSFIDEDYRQYSCAYFKDTKKLGSAQEKKLDLICRKLMLSSEDKVLDIGCGYGGFARYAAERYGCRVTGISPSAEQTGYASSFCDGLPVNFIKADYRLIEGTFNKIVCIGMIEHVGYKNYTALIQKIDECLQEGGLFLLQTIGSPKSVHKGDRWVNRYIFPNSMLPSVKQIARSAEKRLVMEDLHNFGPYYDQTLMAWNRRFIENWPRFAPHFDERVFRMWNYYLLHFAGTFRARLNQLWQIVFSKKPFSGVYHTAR
jgi:cyclopropane-fatty-acyl-phospholipid synthase